MTTKTYTHCVRATGAFTDRTITCSAELLAINPLPDGELWIEGQQNQYCRKATFVVDDFGAEQIVVIDIEPVPPPDSEWQTWDWNAAAGRWDSVPTLKLRKANARPAVLAKLVELDAQQARSAGEISRAYASGVPAAADSLERYDAVEALKVSARAKLAAIEAATTQAELDDATAA